MADISSLRAQLNTSNTPSIASAGTAIAANQDRGAWSITNLGTNPLYVRLGASASTTVFHYLLKGASSQDDGTGGVIAQDMGDVYCGVITIAGSSPRYTTWEGTA